MPGPWSWKTVFETLLGTGTGASVGVGGIWWQTRAQNRTAYEIRLTSSLFEASEVFTFILNSPDISITGRRAGLDSQSLKFKNIAMLCNEGDQELVLLFSDICADLAEKPQELKKNLIAQMMGTITGWRSGLEARENYVKALQKMLEQTKTMPSDFRRMQNPL